jgi:creatinine amidohydrolase
MNPPPTVHDVDADPRGLRLLARRMESIPACLTALGEDKAFRPERRRRPGRVVATGIGSSEAHARHLVGLLNRHASVPAEYLPIGAFGAAEAMDLPDRTLVVFSQGLSSNARTALAKRHRFAGRVLFTASTSAGLRTGGKPDRAEVLERLVAEGTDVVPFPLEDEYTILIRVIGPAAGFLAARLWAGTVEGCRLEPDPRQTAQAATQAYLAGTEAGRRLVDRVPREGFPSGLVMPVSPCLLDRGQNLSCKFVEGFYQPAPAMMDLLQFAHGPFQQLVSQPRPVWVLHREEGTEADLLGRIREMCEGAGLQLLHADTGLAAPEDLLPIEAEGLMNPVVLRLAEGLGIDQVRWPGKGQDGPLYHYTGPIA